MLALAHSPRRGIPPQSYAEHVERVQGKAITNAQRAAAYFAVESSAFIGVVQAAAIYHDLGKLDAANQVVLSRESHDPLPVKHEDAGVAELRRLRHDEAAVLVAAHHVGLFSKDKEREKRGRIFRNLRVADHVDERLAQYVAEHSAAGSPTLSPVEGCPLHRCGFTRRLALSCLVDADHGDTARNYGQEIDDAPPLPRWEERIAVLERHVSGLPQGETNRERERNCLRRRVYEACCDAPIDPAIRACDAPVGSGKTTAVMAHLLRVAKKKNLRHIFVILPYTNIIKQSVEVYRKALVLPEERPEDIVAEHHHQADFQNIAARQLTTLWRAPIIVTTAVQFFETLASHHPARLRKLHELPGSAVFVDETHAAIPSPLWPQVWRWLEVWTQEWGGHLVLASGSLPRFWELPEFVDPPRQSHDIPDLVSAELRRELEQAERRRITPQRREKPLDCQGLIEWVTATKGPRLLILNTVQAAAVVAQAMREKRHDVLHLSTALAPAERERIVDRVKDRLKYKVPDWTLVATSCVEAGMDFSFRTGFRECCSTASLIQIGGRVSRGGEHDEATVWSFRVMDVLLPPHPGFKVSSNVLDRLFDWGDISQLTPSELAKKAMRLEATDKDESRAKDLMAAEGGMEYPTVAQLCRVIDAPTCTVVVDPELAQKLKRHQEVTSRELHRGSVQMWAKKIIDLALSPLIPGGRSDDSDMLYEWTLAYDPDFLGYMAGVLPLLTSLREGLFLV